MISLLRTEIWYQLKMLRRTPDRLLPLILVPLYTSSFLAITENSHRPGLAANAVIGASLMGIWTSALFLAGGLIDEERWGGTLEGLVSAPAPLAVVLFGRIGTVTAVSFIGMLESAAVARLFFGLRLVVFHPMLLALVVLCIWFAVVGTSLIMAGLFTLTRSVRTYQNSVSYPLYLLSGAVVPVSFIPGWLQPISKAIFLYWAASTLRSCFEAAPAPTPVIHLASIVILGAIGAGLGIWTLILVLRRVRITGTIGMV